MDWTKGWIVQQRPAPAAGVAGALTDAVAAFNARFDLLELLTGRCELQRTGATHGGEFHGACPLCGGTDRFVVWPVLGKAWCRRCERQGDVLRWAMWIDGRDPTKRGEASRYMREQGFLTDAPAARSHRPSRQLVAATPKATRPSPSIPDALGPNQDIQDLWIERAGIREFCGGMPRDEAERAALSDVRDLLKLA